MTITLYQELWEKLLELRKASLRLRPPTDTYEPQESKEERKEKRLSQFRKAHNEFRELVDKKRPFYYESVYLQLMDTLNLTSYEAFEYIHKSQKGKDDYNYWASAFVNQEKIVQRIDATCEAIRTRLDQVSII